MCEMELKYVDDRELLEFIAAQVGQVSMKVDSMGKELTEFKQETTGRLDRLEQRLTKIEVVLENETNKQIMLLSEGQEGLHMKVDALSERVDRHDIKIQVIEGGKRA
jgi:archaellum component FlaC